MKAQGVSALVLFPDLIATNVLLTNKYMVGLLYLDKDLLKEYKRTSRGVLDKKKFCKH